MIENTDNQAASDDTVSAAPTIEELETQWWEPLSCECTPGSDD